MVRSFFTVFPLLANSNSPLAKLADYVLLSVPGTFDADCQTIPDGTDIRATQLLLMDTICTQLSHLQSATEKSRSENLSHTLRAFGISK